MKLGSRQHRSSTCEQANRRDRSRHSSSRSTWAKRRRRALLELLEDRQMLAANVFYPFNPLDVGVTDLTLRAEMDGATPVLRLYETGQ